MRMKIVAMVILAGLLSPHLLIANRVNSVDEMLLKTGAKINLPYYKTNKIGLVEIRDPHDLELYNSIVNCHVRGYYRVELGRGERTTITLSEEGEYGLFFPENPQEYAVEVIHQLEATPNMDFIGMMPLHIICGDYTKLRMTIRITRVQTVLH